MPQLFSHLLIIFFLFRHLKLYLQEWGAWYLIFIYASFYTLSLVFLYNIYFWFFLFVQPPLFLTITSWAICVLTLAECVIISTLRIKSEEDTIIWIWGSMYNTQRRLMCLHKMRTQRPATSYNIYQYFNWQTHTLHAAAVNSIIILFRSYILFMGVITIFGLWIPADLIVYLGKCSELILMVTPHLAGYYILNMCTWYAIYKQLVRALNYTILWDLFIPGVIYRLKYNYEQNIMTLRTDILNRHKRYSTTRLSKLFKHIYQLAPGNNMLIQRHLDKYTRGFYVWRPIAAHVPLLFLYTRVKFIKIWTPKLVDFNTEQKIYPIFLVIIFRAYAYKLKLLKRPNRHPYSFLRALNYEFIPLYFLYWGQVTQPRLRVYYKGTTRNIFLGTSQNGITLNNRTLRPVTMRKLRQRIIILLKLVLKSYIVILAKFSKQTTHIVAYSPRITHHKFLKLVITQLRRAISLRHVTLHTTRSHSQITPKLYARRKRRLYRRAYQQ